MTLGSYSPTPATTPTRHPDRVSYDRATVHAVIDEAVLCHVGLVVDGRPVVLPQLHARVGDELYLHGSSGARAMRVAEGAGLAVCVTFSLVDGLVLARSAFHHSINYRSVVVHGLAQVVSDEQEKARVLARLVDAVVPGRSQEVRGPSRRELAATTVLRLPLEQVSYKTRTGPPGDDDADLALPYWAGVLPLTGAVPGVPQPAPGLSTELPVPSSITGWAATARGAASPGSAEGAAASSAARTAGT